MSPYNNPTPTEGFQTAHAAVAAVFVLTAKIVGDRFGLPHLYLWAAAFMLAYAAWKEAWYDPRYESLEKSGGWKGDVMDFLFFLDGTLYAVAVCRIFGAR